MGEDLLIVDEEQNGFEKTKERPDLLAIDKQGNLVVIENKRDDSGKDVTWQAIKYASYYSTLDKGSLIQVYQNFLRKKGDEPEKAEEKLESFLECYSSEDKIYPTKTKDHIGFTFISCRSNVCSSMAAEVWD